MNMKVIFLMILILFTSLAQAASFECSDAKVCIERLICDNPELNTVDEQLGHIYHPLRDALQTGSIEQEKFIRGQKIWLNLRDSLCSLNIDCLIDMYKERIAFLEKIAASLAIKPLSETVPTQAPATFSRPSPTETTTPQYLPPNQLLPQQWNDWEMTCFPWKKHNASVEEAYCTDIVNVTNVNNKAVACFTWQELKTAANLISHCISSAKN